MVQHFLNGPKLSILVQDGPNGIAWSKMVKNVPKGSNIVLKGPTIVKSDNI